MLLLGTYALGLQDFGQAGEVAHMGVELFVTGVKEGEGLAEGGDAAVEGV